MNNELFQLRIKVTEVNEVRHKDRAARLVLFEGIVKGSIFNGVVCAGGVDTQKENFCGVSGLSARYVLSGTDRTGKECKIFVENNGDFNHNFPYTVPHFLTDSEELAWLEEGDYSGMIDNEDGELVIRIFGEEK